MRCTANKSHTWRALSNSRCPASAASTRRRSSSAGEARSGGGCAAAAAAWRACGGRAGAGEVLSRQRGLAALQGFRCGRCVHCQQQLDAGQGPKCSKLTHLQLIDLCHLPPQQLRLCGARCRGERLELAPPGDCEVLGLRLELGSQVRQLSSVAVVQRLGATCPCVGFVVCVAHAQCVGAVPGSSQRHRQGAQLQFCLGAGAVAQWCGAPVPGAQMFQLKQHTSAALLPLRRPLHSAAPPPRRGCSLSAPACARPHRQRLLLRQRLLALGSGARRSLCRLRQASASGRAPPTWCSGAVLLYVDRIKPTYRLHMGPGSADAVLSAAGGTQAVECCGAEAALSISGVSANIDIHSILSKPPVTPLAASDRLHPSQLLPSWPFQQSRQTF